MSQNCFNRLLITLCYFLPFFVYTQSPSFKMVDYTAKDGLPSSEVYFSIVSSKGELWFATEGGISRFNGYEFKNYAIADGLSDNTVFRLYEDNQGRIWYMSFTAGIGYVENEVVRAHPCNKALLEAIEPTYILNLYVDFSEKVWFTTYPYGYGNISKDGEIKYRKRSLKEHTCININEINGQTLIGVTIPENRKSHLLTIIDQANQRNRNIKLNGEVRINRTFHRKSGKVYFGYRINNEYFFGSYKDGILIKRKVTSEINSFFIDRFGRFWLCQDQRGVQIYKSEERFFNNEDFQFEILKGKNVSTITEDQFGGVWVAIQDKGLVFIPNIGFEIIKLNDNSRHNEISGISVNGENEVFYASAHGNIYRLDTNRINTLLIELNCKVRSIQNIKNDELLLVLKPKSPMHKKRNYLQKNGMTYHSFYYKGGLTKSDSFLFINDKNLFIHADGQRKIKSLKSYSYAVNYDDKGRIWVGGKEGLSVLERDSVVPFVFPHQKGKNVVVKQVARFTKNQLVVSVDHQGIVFIDISHTPTIVNFVPLDEFDLNDVHVDEDNDLWLGSERGLTFIAFSDTSFSYELRRLTELHGLSSDHVNKIASSGDTIYVATNNGLTIFRKSQLTLNNQSPLVSFNSVAVNDVNCELDTSYVLRYHENSITFSFSAISYRSAGTVKYAYKLSGVDSEWNYTNAREARYASLKPGNYEFVLKAANEDDVWSKEKKITIFIDQAFWLKSWFWLAGVLLLFGILFIWQKRRENLAALKHEQLRREEVQKRRVAEAKLMALRSQMNPHFTFNSLTAIQNYILNSKKEEAFDYLTKFSMLMRMVLHNSKRSFILLSEELNMLNLYVEMENLRFKNPIQYDVMIAEKTLTKGLMIPSMIIQPFIENAIVHGLAPKKSGEKKLTIEIKEQSDIVYCRITDNGVGRKKSMEIKKRKGLFNKSLGIEITEERLDLLGEAKVKETLQITDLYTKDGEAAGTRVDFYIKPKNGNDNYDYN